MVNLSHDDFLATLDHQAKQSPEHSGPLLQGRCYAKDSSKIWLTSQEWLRATMSNISEFDLSLHY